MERSSHMAHKVKTLYALKIFACKYGDETYLERLNIEKIKPY
jgi:hypothetical protein